MKKSELFASYFWFHHNIHQILRDVDLEIKFFEFSRWSACLRNQFKRYRYLWVEVLGNPSLWIFPSISRIMIQSYIDWNTASIIRYSYDVTAWNNVHSITVHNKLNMISLGIFVESLIHYLLIEYYSFIRIIHHTLWVNNENLEYVDRYSK